MPQLHNLAPGRTAQLAIVFVHGIDGDYRSTWQSEAGCWMDWLVDALPQAQVYSFAHEASKLDYINILSHREIAQHLAIALGQLQQLEHCVLICHSLGGLIAKQAFIQYSEQKLCNVRSFEFIFFGTPHKGVSVPLLSKMASWMIHPRHPVRLLLGQPAELSKLNLDFIDRLSSKHNCKSYYENQRMLGFHLVPEEATKIGEQFPAPIAIMAGHSNICKFKSKDDSVFVSILAQLGDYLRASTTVRIRPFSVGDRLRTRALHMLLDRTTKSNTSPEN